VALHEFFSFRPSTQAGSHLLLKAVKRHLYISLTTPPYHTDGPERWSLTLRNGLLASVPIRAIVFPVFKLLRSDT
jgi:hypothetical protein